MQEYPSFGECLKGILESRELSILEASRIFCMKSSTSLARMIHDEVNSKTLDRFYQQLLDTPQISLTCKEKKALSQALSIQRIGLDQHLARHAMWQLLLDTNRPSAPEDIPLSFYGEKKILPDVSTLSGLVDYLHTCARVDFAVCGCCLPRFLDLLYPLFTEEGNKPRVSMTHFLHNSKGLSHRFVRSIAAIRPFLIFPRYFAFAIDWKQLNPELSAAYQGNEFLCAVVDEHQQPGYFHGVWIDENQIMIMEYPREEFYRFQLDQWNHHRASLSPIKTPPFNLPSVETFIDYAQELYRLETNKMICSIKPDIPLPFVHPDLLLPGLRSGLKALIGSTEHLEPMIEKMYAIHLQRWKNIFEKRKMTHVIFSPAAMESFARTGLQSDHFFAMRPYTPHERRQILMHLRKQMQENPYFNIHFSSDASLPFQLEISGFENTCVLLSDASASYRLHRDYSEACITQENFWQSFKDFYLKELLPSHTLSARESLALMDQLIASIPAEGT